MPVTPTVSYADLAVTERSGLLGQPQRRFLLRVNGADDRLWVETEMGAPSALSFVLPPSPPDEGREERGNRWRCRRGR